MGNCPNKIIGQSVARSRIRNHGGQKKYIVEKEGEKGIAVHTHCGIGKEFRPQANKSECSLISIHRMKKG